MECCYTILILGLSSWIVTGMPAVSETNVEVEPTGNTSDSNKDMYVIHAMVYQVGILTNKTDGDAANDSMMGNQEAVTFYHSNGSNIDLSNIPAPLMTNITAQRMVGVAPTPNSGGPSAANEPHLPWNTLDNLASSPSSTGNSGLRFARTIDTVASGDSKTDGKPEDSPPHLSTNIRRSRENKNEEKTPVKVVKGSAVIPQDAGVQSIAIPPLLTLNNNFSEIPVPIPNTSVVHYAKVNTLVKTP